MKEEGGIMKDEGGIMKDGGEGVFHAGRYSALRNT
jgi:hypothetical protein